MFDVNGEQMDNDRQIWRQNLSMCDGRALRVIISMKKKCYIGPFHNHHNIQSKENSLNAHLQTPIHVPVHFNSWQPITIKEFGRPLKRRKVESQANISWWTYSLLLYVLYTRVSCSLQIPINKLVWWSKKQHLFESGKQKFHLSCQCDMHATGEDTWTISLTRERRRSKQSGSHLLYRHTKQGCLVNRFTPETYTACRILAIIVPSAKSSTLFACSASGYVASWQRKNKV